MNKTTIENRDYTNITVRDSLSGPETTIIEQRTCSTVDSVAVREEVVPDLIRALQDRLPERKELPKKFSVLIHSENHCLAVQEQLFRLGLRWEAGATSPRTYVELGEGLDPVDDIHHLDIGRYRTGRFTFQRSSDSTTPAYRLLTLDDLVVIPDKPEDVTLQLTDDYNAVVTEGVVKVGCQTIPHEKVKELAEAIANYNDELKGGAK